MIFWEDNPGGASPLKEGIMDKYRIDNQMQSVYKYSPRYRAYLFLAGFFEVGISPDMMESKQVRKIRAWEETEDEATTSDRP